MRDHKAKIEESIRNIKDSKRVTSLTLNYGIALGYISGAFDAGIIDYDEFVIYTNQAGKVHDELFELIYEADMLEQDAQDLADWVTYGDYEEE